MGKVTWTKDQEDYLRYLYSEDCLILDITTDFNKKFNTTRTSSSLIHKARKLGLPSSDSRYNTVKNKLDRQKRLNETHMNNDGTLMKIIEYNGATNIIIEFQDEFKYKVQTTYSNFKKGIVKNPYWKQLYGRGYLGVGKYKPYIKKGEKTKAHDAWIRMFERCYSKSYHEKYPTYTDCEVCEEWWNFQNFAEWFYNNYYQINNESMQVDKDWLVVGNKLYCPEKCCIVPHIINSCLSTHDKIKNIDMPIGVSWHKNGSYVARCSYYGKRKTIGYYNNVNDAEQAYWNFKINYIEQLANEYKEDIPQQVYMAMINFKNTYKQRYGLVTGGNV